VVAFVYRARDKGLPLGIIILGPSAATTWPM
jgi:hypothetical protein